MPSISFQKWLCPKENLAENYKMLFTFAQYDTEVLISLNIMQQMRDTAANW